MWLHSHKASAAVGIWVDIASKIFTAVTTLFSPSKADEFFKLWRQRKDDTGRPFGDDKMFDMSEYAQHEKLEEMGFPPLHDDKGQVQPRGMHPFPFSSLLFFIQLEVLVTASDTFGFMMILLGL